MDAKVDKSDSIDAGFEANGADSAYDLDRTIKVELNDPVIENDVYKDCIDSYSCGLCLTEFSERQHLLEHLNWHMDKEIDNTANECQEKSMTNLQLDHQSSSTMDLQRKTERLDNGQNHQHMLENNCVEQDLIEPTDELSVESDTSSRDSEYSPKRKVYKSKKKKSFELDQFAGTFTKINTQKKRKKRDPKTYTCNACGQTFNTRYLLKVHERSHTGINPYKCEFCDKIYSCISSLNLHKQIHSESKEYKCDVCHKIFIADRYLKRHMIVHKGVKDFICDICGKAFLQRGNLREHQKIHSGEKPHVCEICDCAFARGYELSLHIKKHTGEKPFACDICGNSYRRSIDLKYHKRIHSGERPYFCVPCQKSYITSSSLSLHNKRVHSGIKSGSLTLFGNKSDIGIKIKIESL